MRASSPHAKLQPEANHKGLPCLNTTRSESKAIWIRAGMRNIMANYRIYLSVILASIVVIGIVAAAARYLREINTVREALNNLGSQVVETDCGPIEYARIGEGYPVLVVHGDMGGFDQGLMLANQVIDRGYQVVSVSRFGYLRTPMPAEVNVTRQADAHGCLLDALGIQQAAVFAFSAGATSSIRFAARYPERVSALILHCPAAPGKVKVSSPPRAIFDTLMRSDFVYWAFITYLRPYRIVGVPRGFALTPEFEAEAKDILAKTLPLSERMDGFMFDTYGAQPEFYESISQTSPYPLDQIETPVLLINAADDPYAVPENVRGLAGKLPNARLYVVPDGGHPLLGHSEEVKAEITQFLRSKVTVLKSSH
jgi:pimeloyl-ACP methyl ester carboxylesterase